MTSDVSTLELRTADAACQGSKGEQDVMITEIADTDEGRREWGSLVAAMCLLLVAAAFLALCLLVWVRCQRRRAPPGPRPLPFLGDANLFARRGGPLRPILDLYQRFGAPCRFHLQSQMYVLLTNPRHLQQVLGGSRFLNRDAMMMNVMRPHAGDGLLTARAPLWTLRRKLLSRVFHALWLQSQESALGVAAEALANSLTGHDDVPRRLALGTLHIVAASVLGAPLEKNVADAFMEAIGIMHYRVMRPWLLLNWIFSLTSIDLKQAKLVRILHGYFDAAIAKARHSASDGDSLSLLDTLTRLCDDDEVLKDEIATLFIAGQDTTATAICFVLTLLALHPEVQERCVEDQDLLERGILETMRLFPPTAFMAREITSDVELIGIDHVLPRGCIAIMCTMISQRLPDFWKDPLLFDPDRFLPEQLKGRHPYCFLPFGGGPRSCIGQKFAMMLMKTILSKILASYLVYTSLTRQDLEDLNMGMVITPAKGFNLKFQLKN